MGRAAILLFAAAVLRAETFQGTLVDSTCRGADLPNHSRECVLKCGRAGFGLVLSGGQFLKFDEKGNALALRLVRAAARDKDLKAAVAGTIDGPVLKVQSIEWK